MDEVTEPGRQETGLFLRVGRILALAYLALLTWILFTPRPFAILSDRLGGAAEQLQTSLSDDLLHGGAFLLLAFLLLTFFQRPLAGRRPCQVFAIAGYAIIAEVSHNWIPLRSFQWSDLAANLAGVMVGTLACVLLPRLARFKSAAS